MSTAEISDLRKKQDILYTKKTAAEEMAVHFGVEPPYTEFNTWVAQNKPALVKKLFLDPTNPNPDEFFTNIIRVARVKDTLERITIPTFAQKIASIKEQLEQMKPQAEQRLTEIEPELAAKIKLFENAGLKESNIEVVRRIYDQERLTLEQFLGRETQSETSRENNAAEESTTSQSIEADKKEPRFPVKNFAILRRFLDDPELTVEEILSLLGNSRAGRPYTWNQALSSLQTSTRFIFGRVYKEMSPVRASRGIATQEEIDIFNDIHELIDANTEKEYLHGFWKALDTWFRANKDRAIANKLPNQPAPDLSDTIIEPTEEIVEKTPETFTDDEAILLASLILNFDGTDVKFGREVLLTGAVDDSIKEIAGKVRSLRPSVNNSQLTDNQRLQMRSTVLSKLNRILKDETLLNEVFSSQTADIQELIFWLFSEDQDKYGGILTNLLGIQREATRVPNRQQWDVMQAQNPVIIVTPEIATRLKQVTGQSQPSTPEPRAPRRRVISPRTPAQQAVSTDNPPVTNEITLPVPEQPVASLPEPQPTLEVKSDSEQMLDLLKSNDPQFEENLTFTIQFIRDLQIDVFTIRMIHAHTSIGADSLKKLTQKKLVRPIGKHGRYSADEVMIMSYLNNHFNYTGEINPQTLNQTLKIAFYNKQIELYSSRNRSQNQ